MGKKEEGEASCLSRQPVFCCSLSIWAGRTIFSPSSLFSLPPPATPAKKIRTASKSENSDMASTHHSGMEHHDHGRHQSRTPAQASGNGHNHHHGMMVADFRRRFLVSIVAT